MSTPEQYDAVSDAMKLSDMRMFSGNPDMYATADALTADWRRCQNVCDRLSAMNPECANRYDDQLRQAQERIVDEIVETFGARNVVEVGERAHIRLKVRETLT